MSTFTKLHEPINQGIIRPLNLGRWKRLTWEKLTLKGLWKRFCERKELWLCTYRRVKMRSLILRCLSLALLVCSVRRRVRRWMTVFWCSYCYFWRFFYCSCFLYKFFFVMLLMMFNCEKATFWFITRHCFIVWRVAAGFALWWIWPHRVRPHIDSSSDQVLKIYLSLTQKKRQHWAHDETKPHKACLFLVF